VLTWCEYDILRAIWYYTWLRYAILIIIIDIIVIIHDVDRHINLSIKLFKY
jgi:hypothetical protein